MFPAVFAARKIRTGYHPVKADDPLSKG
jgi:hypothetical protein